MSNPASPSPFGHLQKSLRQVKYREVAIWRPDSWESSTTPPPELHVIWFHESNPRMKRAVMNPRFPQLRKRADGKESAKAYEKSKQRMMLLTIVACVVGWKVLDAEGKEMTFPKIGEEPVDPGVKVIEALLLALDGEGGVNREVESFVRFCGDRDSFLDYEDDEDAAEDAPGTRPL